MARSVTKTLHSGEIDLHVGSRIRLRRTQLGLSQEKLGEALGITFQQIQKYERGANRVGASRLYHIASILDVPISFFFDDMGNGRQTFRSQPPSPMGEVAEQRSPFNKSAHPSICVSSEDQALLSRKETLELVRAYYRIPKPVLRKKILDLITSMTDAPAAD
ncbi:helix-turn-helix domain-containing protein [Acetobacter peroxydans]|jgi:transcriptional regulator with XRE-family HTH domain|nr:helix-turn-helix transcriptional regulator [Acetobacter peroxydans]NHO16306.1 helix-turn-helix domain-containing protein [Acetobacter peroxydans]